MSSPPSPSSNSTADAKIVDRASHMDSLFSRDGRDSSNIDRIRSQSYNAQHRINRDDPGFLTPAHRHSYSIDDTDPKPPKLMRQSNLLVRVYYINHHWKSVIAKSAIVAYMSTIFWILFRESDPWYEFFYYLTLQGWTLELIYFSYSLYLDLLSRWYGGPDYISRISKAAAQALSELVFALQVVIVMFFWLVVYPQETFRSVIWELNCHGIGLLLMILDYLYRFTGFSLRNHRFVLFFAVTYTSLYSFVVLYLGKSIYPGIDLRSVMSISIFLAGLSTVVVTHKVFYLISNWQFIKNDVKSILGVSKVILFRQNSIDMFTHGITEFGSELLSISPRAAPLPPRSREDTKPDSFKTDKKDI